MRSLLLPLLLFLSTQVFAQSPLQTRIADAAAGARGRVAVACSLPGVELDCNYHADVPGPMQSVFKFPLAIAVLQQVEAGKLKLDEQVRFGTADLYPGSYSPLQDKYPKAGVDVPLRELLRLSVSLSDNVATDILLRLIGGPEVVQRSMDALGFPEIHVRDSERSMHDDESRQYRNDATVEAMVRLLRRVADHSPLTPLHTAQLNEWMEGLVSSPKRIRGLLPAGTVVAHKSGSSGVEHGMAAATNDVGLITLPNGQRLAVAIFVTDAHADNDAIEASIAKIAKAIYDEAVAKTAR